MHSDKHLQKCAAMINESPDFYDITKKAPNLTKPYVFMLPGNGVGCNLSCEN